MRIMPLEAASYIGSAFGGGNACPMRKVTNGIQTTGFSLHQALRASSKAATTSAKPAPRSLSVM